MLNYNEMSKEMLIAHIQTMDMQLNAFAKAGAEKEYLIAELEHQLQDRSAQAFSIGETYANALSRIAELEAQIAAASAPVVEQQPSGYIRKWAFDGEKPEKRLNANNRMAWPGKFKFLPVTQAKILPDDIPLYVAPQAADTEKLLEAILSLPLPRPNFYDTTLRQDAYSIGQVNMILRSAADLVASTALQAPVREVPEVIGAIANAPVMEPIPVGISFSEQHCNFYRADTGQGMGNEFYDKWRDRADEFPDRITARAAIKAAPLPAAQVQEPKP